MFKNFIVQPPIYFQSNKIEDVRALFQSATFFRYTYTYLNVIPSMHTDYANVLLFFVNRAEEETFTEPTVIS